MYSCGFKVGEFYFLRVISTLADDSNVRKFAVPRLNCNCINLLCVPRGQLYVVLGLGNLKFHYIRL